MTRHALRTLVKTDNGEALELLGYPSKPQFTLRKVSVPQTVRIGESVEWRGMLESKTSQNLKIALRIHFLKANGTHSARVFAVKDIEAAKGQISIEKNISIKPLTTRTLYPGIHQIELVVNGVARGRKSFELAV